MSAEKFQSNLPLVKGDGMPTDTTQILLEKLVTEVLALRAIVDDHEARLLAIGA
jgi:hypothetical protein